MKIALLGSKSFDSLEYHLNDTLCGLGHSVFHIDIKDVSNIPYNYNYWAIKLFKSYDKNLFLKIARRIIESEPELVIVTYRFTHPECIKLIKKTLPKVKIVHVNPDALITFEYQQIFASPYDAYFTKDPYIVDFMTKKMKLNAIYLPEAFNPRVHKMPSTNRIDLERKINIDVVAFGTMYPYRANMANELIKAGVNMSLFGTANSRFGLPAIGDHFINEFITGDRKAEVICGSKIVFNNFHYSEIESVNAKFFEIGGIGGFQICDYKPIIAEYSKIPTEKFTYKSIDEAIELIEHYLTRPEERHQLAMEQYDHFQLHHTYEHRIKAIFECIF